MGLMFQKSSMVSSGTRRARMASLRSCADTPSNMQLQTVQTAKLKDRTKSDTGRRC